jgi:hypothetical protein
MGFEFWTSGSNEGEHCSVQNIYTWCSSTSNDSLFEPEFLATTEQKFFRDFDTRNIVNDRCIIMKFNATVNASSGFEHAACNKTLKYICEVFASKCVVWL